MAMPSRLSGIGLMGIQEKVLDLHVRAWNEDFVALPVGGFFRYRRGGESHAWEAGLIHTLQHAVATDSYMTYRKFSEGVHNQPPNTLRDLLDRSEEHTSELQSLMRISSAVFCLKQKKKQ